MDRIQMVNEGIFVVARKLLRPVVVIALVGAAIIGFWLTDIYRFHQEGLRNRMSFYAALLQLRQPSFSTSNPLSDAEKHSLTEKQLKQQLSDIEALYEIGTRQEAVLPRLVELAEAKDRISRDQLGIDLMNAVWNLFDMFWEKNSVANSWDKWKIPGENNDIHSIQPDIPKPNFSNDYWRFRGIDPTRPAVPPDELIANAKDFLSYREILTSRKQFLKRWKFVPPHYIFEPQALFKFYDERRTELSDTLPYAFGVILLACTFFLNFRLHDYGDEDVKSGLRMSLWEDTGGRPTLFSNPAAPWLCLTFTVLALFVEFFCNEPTTRVEWWVNAPIMALSGSALAILWTTLWDIFSNARLNPRLKELKVEARVLRFRFFTLGFLSVVFSMLWAIGDSYFRVMRHGSSRAVLQIVIASITLTLLVCVGIKVCSSIAGMKLPPPGEGTVDPERPAKLWHPFIHILPAASEGMSEAILLSLVPLKTVFTWLLP